MDAGGQYAVTCSDDLTSRVWNLDTGECISVLKVRAAGEAGRGWRLMACTS